MDTKYLISTVGDILARGIAEVIEKQPEDPIEYLALWMLHQEKLAQKQQERIGEYKKLEEERQFARRQQEIRKQSAGRFLFKILADFRAKVAKQRREDAAKLKAMLEKKEKLAGT